MSRRRLNYICIDTSGSMHGSRIRSANRAIWHYVDSLGRNPYSLETDWLTIMAFDSEVREILPIISVIDIRNVPEIICNRSGAGFLGAMLERVCSDIRHFVRLGSFESKGDYNPNLYIVSDGRPADISVYRNILPIFKQLKEDYSISCFCYGIGSADFGYLEELSPDILVRGNELHKQFFPLITSELWYRFLEAPLFANRKDAEEWDTDFFYSLHQELESLIKNKEKDMSRRLLTYICIDTSGSMRGEPVEAVNTGLHALLASLRQNPYALESVHLSIITFDSLIKTVLPLTPLEQVVLPEITCPESGATFLGGVLEHVVEAVRRDRITGTADQKGDWRPILIVLTDGKPTDLLAYSEVLPEIKKLGFGNIVACAAGPKADPSYLKQLTDTVVSLDTMDASSFAKFFQWVSASVAGSSISAGSPNASAELPPPPPEINMVM